jgi:hypothetical protein
MSPIRSSLNRILASVSLVVVTGCQSPQVPEAARPQVSAPPAQPDDQTWRLELADAVALSSSMDFRSAIALASTRPKPPREVAQFTFEVTSTDPPATVRSIMRFSPLANGLDHVSHDVPALPGNSALHETFVTAHGVGTVFYWNSRFSGRQPRPAPSEYRLLSGRLYSIDSPFVMEERKEDGRVITTSCSPGTPFSASTLHEDLTGLAVVFDCSIAPVRVTKREWYLADAGRYLLSELSMDGELFTSIKIAGIRYADARPR